MPFNPRYLLLPATLIVAGVGFRLFKQSQVPPPPPQPQNFKPTPTPRDPNLIKSVPVAENARPIPTPVGYAGDPIEIKKIVSGLAFSPDGKRLAVSVVAYDDSRGYYYPNTRVEERDTKNWQVIRQIPFPGDILAERGVYRIQYSKDGRSLYMATPQSVSVFDTRTGKSRRIANVPLSLGEALAPDASFYASFDTQPPKTTVVITDLKTGRDKYKLLWKDNFQTNHPAISKKYLFAPGMTLGTKPGTLRIVRLDRGTILRTLPFDSGVLGAAFSPTNPNLLVYTDRYIHMYDVAKNKELARYQLPHFVGKVAFSQDGSRLALTETTAIMTAKDYEMRNSLTAIHTFKVTSTGLQTSRSLTGSADPVMHVAFSPDMKTLVSSTSSGYFNVWKLR